MRGCVAMLVCLGLAFPARGEDSERELSERAHAVLNARCVTCHGPEKAEANFRLDSREALLKGGDRGPALASSEPNRSLLLQSINGTADDLQMPPKQKLSPEEIAIVARWLKAGAPWPIRSTPTGHPAVSAGERIGDAWSDPRNPIVTLYSGRRLDLWSLKPVKHHEPPQVDNMGWVHNEIDQFVLAQFERQGLAAPVAAERHTLVRRLYLDLIGLPPAPEEAAAFEAGNSHQDIEKVVDALLGSPRFGEHFARMWLDVVRYSDSNGFDWDEFRPQAWRFRDYVIRSFNADKPFDQFVREQLAGDELFAGPPQSPEQQDALIATGYLRLGPHDNAAGLFNEQDRSRHELLTDLVETTGSAFLGLTLACCRCHDHKYDPLSQADHYRLRACFAGVRFADDVPLDLAVEQAAIDSHNKIIDERIAEFETRRQAIDAEVRRRLGKEKLEGAELEAALSADERKQRDDLQAQIDSARQQKRPHTQGLLMIDAPGRPAVTQVLYQGDHKSPREIVQPGVLSVLDPNPLTITTPPRPESSGRRLALANWITTPSNTLTSRVFVNRVWQNLMGQPLVRTPGDFGLAGEKPDEPMLLDWLATTFVQDGWSVKKLVKRIVLSATYRQRAAFGDPPASVTHFVRRPRRMTAEQLRDSMLFVSGLLTDKAQGKPIWPDLPKEVLEANPAFLDDNALKIKGWYPSPEPEQYCRSVFLVQKRNTRVPLLESFDQPDNSVPCARRNTSIVAPQAISLLNGPLSTKAAQHFAQRVQAGSPNVATQVRFAFAFALQRRPTIDEQVACERLLKTLSLAELCRVLLNLTEFAYLD